MAHLELTLWPTCSVAGTNLEGPWSQVMDAIGQCHAAVHAVSPFASRVSALVSRTCRPPLTLFFRAAGRQMGTPRIATDIRIGTRTDKKIAPGEGNKGKVARVVEILGKDQAKA